MDNGLALDKALGGSRLALAGDRSLTMDERHLILQGTFS